MQKLLLLLLVVFSITLGIPTIKPAETCFVYQIDNGAITEKSSIQNSFDWRQFMYIFKTVYKKVPIETTIAPGVQLHVTCDKGYTFQGRGNNNVSIRCMGSNWYPDPVCLLTGTNYEPEVQRAKTTPEHPTTENKDSDSAVKSTPPPRKDKNPLEDEPPPIIDRDDPSFCFCEFVNYNPALVAYVGHIRLRRRDRVQKGMTVKFQCEESGIAGLQGMAELKCETCQRWHPSEFPSCMDFVAVEEKRCEAFKEDVHIIHYDKDRKINSSAWFYCRKVNYRPVGSTVLNCLPNSRWSGSPPTCEAEEKRCEAFKEDIHVIHYDKDREVNSSAWFYCRKLDYRPVGSTVLNCLSSGEWSGSPPKCEGNDCPEIGKIEGMEVSFSDELHVGSTATFHCIPPRTLSGPSRIRCRKSGSWSGSVPSCSLSECSLESLLNVVPNNVLPQLEDIIGESMSYESTVRLTCSNSLRLVGNPVATCGRRGRWEVGKIQCVSGCVPFEKPPSSELMIEPQKDFYMFGEFMLFSCPFGLTLTPNVQRVMCLGSTWSGGKIPECEPPL